MNRNYASVGSSNFNRITEIDKEMLKLDEVMSSKSQEIIKSEKLLCEFYDSLCSQNDKLQMLSNEKMKLEEEKASLDEESCQNKKVVSVLQNTKGGHTIIIRQEEFLSLIGEVCEIEKLNMCDQINSRKVHMIVKHDDFIYICGSNGLLQRYSLSGSYSYDAGTEEDIFRIELSKHKQISSLYAFTRENVIIFEDTEGDFYNSTHIPGINHVAGYNDCIYILCKSGMILLRNPEKCFKPVAPLSIGGVRGFAYATGGNEYSLLISENSILYAATYIRLVLAIDVSVNPISGVLGCLNLGGPNYLYYTKNTVKLLNKVKCKLVYKLYLNGNTETEKRL